MHHRHSPRVKMLNHAEINDIKPSDIDVLKQIWPSIHGTCPSRVAEVSKFKFKKCTAIGSKNKFCLQDLRQTAIIFPELLNSCLWFWHHSSTFLSCLSSNFNSSQSLWAHFTSVARVKFFSTQSTWVSCKFPLSPQLNCAFPLDHCFNCFLCYNQLFATPRPDGSRRQSGETTHLKHLWKGILTINAKMEKHAAKAPFATVMRPLWYDFWLSCKSR